MGTNIKNPAAEEALRLLADHYRTSVPQAIIRAAADVLRESAEDRRRRISDRMEAGITEFWGRNPGLTSEDFLTDRDLYDEDGLPK